MDLLSKILVFVNFLIIMLRINKWGLWNDVEHKCLYKCVDVEHKCLYDVNSHKL